MGYKLKRITIRQNNEEKQIRPKVEPIWLCFTANTASSTIKLVKTGTPNDATLETSTDGRSWSTYSFGDSVTLSNIGDKVYWRNTSTTDTGFSKNTSNYYHYTITGSISASGDINCLLNKNSTDTLSSGCYCRLFYGCSNLTTAPALSVTTLDTQCYRQMFYNCTGLTTLPALPATTLSDYCYNGMFQGCTNIKLSDTQTGEYQTAYRIPTTGTGTTASFALGNMFNGTGGTYTSEPSVNTTYYTSNTVVS